MKELYTDPEVLPPEQLLAPDQNDSWQEIAPGFFQTEYLIEEINVKWACVKIDLDTPGLQLQATPHKKDLGKRFVLEKVAKSRNASEAAVSVTVNTTPFDLKGRSYIPVGVIKIDGEQICNPEESYCALLLNYQQDLEQGLRAEIISSQKEDLIEQSDFAFGGFYQILDGEVIFPFAKYKRSRTACGTSQDGRFLYLFATCALNYPTGRSGLNFEECAVILKDLGCQNAMEFDGGHSSGLVINGLNIIRPSLQRKVPATLTIYVN